MERDSSPRRPRHRPWEEWWGGLKRPSGGDTVSVVTTYRNEARAWKGRRGLALVGLIAVALLLGSGEARADEKQDIEKSKEEIEELRREQRANKEAIAVQAASVDVAVAEFSEVSEALDVLNQDVSAAEQRVAAAQQAVLDASLALDSIEEQERFVREETATVRDALQDLVVEWYVSGRNPSVASNVVSLDTDSPTQAALKKALFRVRLGQETDLVDRLRELTDDLDLIAANRERALAEATERGAALEILLAEVEAARDRQEQFAALVESRLDARLAEAAALEAIDSELAQKIRNEENEIARKLASIKRKEELARRAAAIPNIVGSGEIVSVSGVRVHRSISQNVANMFAAAARDGILLGGGGYRSSASQIALRRAHCGTSDYAVYNKPAATCRPPTARPGHSMHERGLALDITANGRILTSRNTAGFKWLAANAATYGFFNLKTEPWHWSINGR